MINATVLEILNTYGLPTALSIMFIWFYKQSSDKYNNFLKNAVESEVKRSEKTDEIIKEINKTQNSIHEMERRITELQKTIMAYLLSNKDGCQ
jgi:CRISPR/Cas system CMR subunit Cmr6 (Cas7 group RAMP superfamily)